MNQLLPPNQILQSLVTTKQAIDAQGNPHRLRDEISTDNCRALYQSVLANKPKMVVEVGMAFGIATLSILTALDEVGGDGQLVSIDPNQNSEYCGVGVENVRRAGFAERHRLIERPSFLGLPQLLEEKAAIDFAYIDGWHTFDYALVDFFYLDKMLRPFGIVAFNDCGWRAVHRVIKFVRSHRHYDELDVGLSRKYQGRNLASTALRLIEGRSSADRYFRKGDSFEPNWNFYARF